MFLCSRSETICSAAAVGRPVVCLAGSKLLPRSQGLTVKQAMSPSAATLKEDDKGRKGCLRMGLEQRGRDLRQGDL